MQSFGKCSDHVIYVQFQGLMTKIAEPKGSRDRCNFVITYKGRDWSGFRTIDECVAQFKELETRTGDHFEVVER